MKKTFPAQLVHKLSPDCVAGLVVFVALNLQTPKIQVTLAVFQLIFNTPHNPCKSSNRERSQQGRAVSF